MVKNLKDLMKRFSNEQDCRDYLVQQRWNGKPVCPYCGCDKSYRIENGKRFKCANKECYKKYSVTVGTVFEASNIPLTTWFPAMYFITAHKKGISSVQLAKNLGVTQKTAWFMLHRIRESLKQNNPGLLGGNGIVEADVTYVGGKIANKSNRDRKEFATHLDWRINKTPVLGIIERGGNLVAKVVGKGLGIEGKSTEFEIRKHVEYAATLVTDSAPCNVPLNDDYHHHMVNHAKNEFARLHFHTNSIEGAFSHFKRMVIGTYHQLSVKHLGNYVDEFTYRYNSRKLQDGFRFTLSLQGIEGRLTYKQLVYGKEGQSKESQ